jgi:hypothetical protein
MDASRKDQCGMYRAPRTGNAKRLTDGSEEDFVMYHPTYQTGICEANVSPTGVPLANPECFQDPQILSLLLGLSSSEAQKAWRIARGSK